MKINWKLRLQNKTTLLALAGAVLAFVYTLLGLLGIVPGVSESQLLEVLGLLLNVLALLGIVTDPTTPGVGDSPRAMDYSEPGGSL